MHKTLDFMFKRIDSCPDALTQVLEAAQLGGRLSASMSVKAPWGLRFGYVERLAGFHVVLRGTCWLVFEGDVPPVRLESGDVVLLPHGTAHVLCDEPGTQAVDLHRHAARIAPGQTIDLPGGSGAECALLCGSYSLSLDSGNPLLYGLPEVIHLQGADIGGGTLAATIRMLEAEAARASPGSALVIDRLVDLMFVHALRAWLAIQADDAGESWLGALADPVVGPALHAVHADPTFQWTVDAMARAVGVSRAAFARRFRNAVGEPPLAYVTRWRMAVAAEFLERGERAARVAGRVGYDDEYAFAKAFKRVRGVSPGAHRRRYVRQATQPIAPDGAGRDTP
jgi:AraC-like DNA-binding protein